MLRGGGQGRKFSLMEISAKQDQKEKANSCFPSFSNQKKEIRNKN